MSKEIIKKLMKQIKMQKEIQTECFEKTNEQRKKERKFVEQMSKCPIKDIGRKLPYIDFRKLKDENQREFDNPNVMDLNRDIMSGIYYHAEHTSGNNQGAMEVAEWFTDGKRIGEASANGIAMMSSIRDGKNIAVIKAPLGEMEDMYHEIFVASEGTNRLRGKIPNFAYVYGGFQCAPSYMGSDGKVYSTCGIDTGKNIKTQFIVYEAIDPSVGLKEAIGDISTHTLYNLLLQTTLATWMAYKEFGWTHYDLHYDNVLVRDVPHHNNFYIKYEFDGKYYYLKCEKVSTIIDYGMSHIELVEGNKKSHYGYCFTEYGIDPDISSPLHDVYKLLMFTSMGAINGGKVEHLTLLEKIFSFFSDEDLVSAVARQKKLLLFLSQILRTLRFNHGKVRIFYVEKISRICRKYYKRVHTSRRLVAR
jgi:hypothetical protein